MPGFIAMTSVFAVVGIEMFFASRGAGHVHTTNYETLGMDDRRGADPPPQKRSHSYGRYSNGTSSTDAPVPPIVLHDIEASDSDYLIAGRSPSFSHASPVTPTAPYGRATRDSLDDRNDSDLDFTAEELDSRAARASEEESRPLSNAHDHSHGHAHHRSTDSSEDSSKTEAQNQKLLLQCLLLEAGILFHSIFIGMALSVATGTSFAVLLVAISFHQTFEGFALGSRISAVRFPAGSPKPWLMAMAYGTTTPLGQAIGLAIHTLYDPASQVGLLTVGFMNAISSGLLLFAGLVELLAEDFLSDESYVTLHGKRRLQACASVVAGALLMAIVGAWA